MSFIQTINLIFLFFTQTFAINLVPNPYFEASVANWPCPEATIIQPCTCVADEFGHLDMNCSGANSEQEISAAFENCLQQFPFTTFRDLLIIHEEGQSGITELTSQTFCSATFLNIEIRGTNITTIEEDVFSSSHNTLVDLNLQLNQISQFPFEVLYSYTNLKSINIQSNKLLNLPDLRSSSLNSLNIGYNTGLQFSGTVFQETPAMQQIYMQSIGLKSLPERVFNLPEITVVDLSKNELTIIESQTLNSHTQTLSIIVLSDNELEIIEVGGLSGITSDGSIILSRNNIKDIQQDVWGPVFADMTGGQIDFSDNPLICGCGMHWLVSDTNAMEKIEKDAMCYGGTQLVVDLPLEAFDYHCSASKSY